MKAPIVNMKLRVAQAFCLAYKIAFSLIFIRAIADALAHRLWTALIDVAMLIVASELSDMYAVEKSQIKTERVGNDNR